MIKRFKHKGLRRYFIDNDKSLLDRRLLKKIKRRLDRLDSAEEVEDMNLPGYRLHSLKGNRKEVWSVDVSANWRMTFNFESGHAYDVNLEDYH